MPKYRLYIHGYGMEQFYSELTPEQGRFWIEQDESYLHQYIFQTDDEDRLEFNIPDAAHIDGYYHELCDLYQGCGPYSGDCELYEFDEEGKEKLIWECDIDDINVAKDKNGDQIVKEIKTRMKYILILASIEKSTFSYEWHNVDKEPKKDDFKLVWMANDSIVDDVLLKGKEPELRDISGEGKSFSAEVVTREDLIQ